MKFTVEKALASGGRIGRITQTSSNGSKATFESETPMCTLFTKGGSAPHLSLDMLKRIENVPAIASVSIGTLANYFKNVKEFEKGLGEFTGFKDKFIFTTLHDASLAMNPGKNDKNGIAVWGKSGKVKLDPPLHIQVQEAFQPDWFQSLSDGDTDSSSGPKRLKKSVDRTLDFLDDVIQLQEKSEVLKNSDLIGVIEGGFSEEERKRSALETASRKAVRGFLIEGFQKGNSEEDLFSIDNFSDILSKTIGHLPEDKPRIMESVWSPLAVIKAVQLGIDVFSSAYPHTLTERGTAMALDFCLPPASQAGVLELEGSKSLTNDPVLDLNDKKYFEDFGPVLKTCKCYCCANFTRSYIHHLLNTSELLAYVLLTIHNFHQYFLFFEDLREAMRNNRLSELEESIQKQEGTTGLER